MEALDSSLRSEWQFGGPGRLNSYLPLRADDGQALTHYIVRRYSVARYKRANRVVSRRR